MKTYEELSRMRVNAAIQEGLRSQNVHRQLNQRGERSKISVRSIARVLLSLAQQVFQRQSPSQRQRHHLPEINTYDMLTKRSE
jgi:hypothetical protein